MDFTDFKDMLGNTCEHTVKVGHCKHGAPNKVAKADLKKDNNQMHKVNFMMK